jgi:hypothetical protein
MIFEYPAAQNDADPDAANKSFACGEKTPPAMQ